LRNVQSPRRIRATFRVSGREVVDEAGCHDVGLAFSSRQRESGRVTPSALVQRTLRNLCPCSSGGEYWPTAQLKLPTRSHDASFGSFGLSSGVHATVGSASSACPEIFSVPPSHFSERWARIPHVLMLSPARPHEIVTSQSEQERISTGYPPKKTINAA